MQLMFIQGIYTMFSRLWIMFNTGLWIPVNSIFLKNKFVSVQQYIYLSCTKKCL